MNSYESWSYLTYIIDNMDESKIQDIVQSSWSPEVFTIHQVVGWLGIWMLL